MPDVIQQYDVIVGVQGKSRGGCASQACYSFRRELIRSKFYHFYYTVLHILTCCSSGLHAWWRKHWPVSLKFSLMHLIASTNKDGHVEVISWGSALLLRDGKGRGGYMSCESSITVYNTTQALISLLSFIPTPCRPISVTQNSALLLCSTLSHSIWPFSHTHCSTAPCWTLDQLMPTSKNS